MTTIQILGTGCAKCRNLAVVAEQALKEAEVHGEVVKVQEITDMLAYDGVSALPALAINGRVKFCGRVPGIEEIKQLLA